MLNFKFRILEIRITNKEVRMSLLCFVHICSHRFEIINQFRNVQLFYINYSSYCPYIIKWNTDFLLKNIEFQIKTGSFHTITVSVYSTAMSTVGEQYIPLRNKATPYMYTDTFLNERLTIIPTVKWLKNRSVGKILTKHIKRPDKVGQRSDKTFKMI